MIAFPRWRLVAGGQHMTTLAIAEGLAGRLYAAETAIEAALVETASLMAALPSARAGACLSAVTGQRAFDGVAASVSALTGARAHIVETHNALAAVARRLGLDDLAVGPLDKPQDAPPIGGTRSALDLEIHGEQITTGAS